MTGSIQVEAPTITFADGKAAITAAAGATIYYTMSTDSEPADPMIDETQKYTGEIEILLSQGLTVKAIAVQYSLSSEVAEDTYKMTITPSRDSFTGGGTVTLTIANAPEGAEVSVTCDHTAYNPTKGADGAWSVTLPNASETYTFTATAAVGEKTYTDTCQVEVTRKSTGSSSSRPGSGSSSSSTTTETVTNPDGSKTTTVTNNRMDTVTETTEYPDGTTITTVTNERTDTVTQTTEYADGSSEMVETRKDGTVTTTTTDADGNETAVVENPDGSREVSVEQADGTSASAVTDADGRTKAEVSLSSRAVSAAQEEGGAVTLPIPEIPVSYDSEDASFVEIDLPRSAGAVKVEIPIPAENTAPGTVAVIVNEDGTETVVKKSVALDGGLTLTLETGATVKIVDNSKDFDDTYGHWAEDAIDFATAHEMFGGTSATTFSPDTPMTRGMLAVVLHRFENAPNHTFTESFEDVAPGSWYADGIHWMAENGIVGGYGDGNFGANDNITREQLAAILYRYANVMGYGTSGSTSLNRFSDVDSVSGYAAEAMGWAVRNGLIGGVGDGTLAPQGNATRAQVATILMRFVENLVQ